MATQRAIKVRAGDQLRLMLGDPKILSSLHAMAVQILPYQEASDVVQSTCVRALEAKAPPAARGACRSWLFGILNKEASKVLEHRSRMKASDLLDDTFAEAGYRTHVDHPLDLMGRDYEKNRSLRFYG